MKYSLNPREITRAKRKGFPEGSDYISSYFLTQVKIKTFSTTNLPGKSILENTGKYGPVE